MARPLAVVAGVLLLGLVGLQLGLALGLPLGELAWGGRFAGELPPFYRGASGGAVVVLALAGWAVLAGAGVVRAGAGSCAARPGCRVFGVYFGLNTVGNLASHSVAERLALTPISLVLCVCFLLVAREAGVRERGIRPRTDPSASRHAD